MDEAGHRLRAPATDGGLLAVPPLAEVGGPLHSQCANGSPAGTTTSRAVGPARLRGLVRREVMVCRMQLSPPPWSGRARIAPCSGDSAITPWS